MHFVSSQSEAEQITDIVKFFTEHIEDSIQAPQTSPAFAGFQSKIDKLNGDKDYKGMLNYLLSIKSELLSLPTSHKNQQLTIQRAVLLVLPLLKTQEKRVSKDKKFYEELKHITVEFCKLLEESEYPLSIKVNSVLHIFSIFDEKSALKGIVFQRLFELCDRNDQLKIIVENVKNIEEISKEWELSLDERRELYRACAQTLDKNNESVAAFKVSVAYLKLFNKCNDQELATFKIENEAQRCVLLGVKVPTVIDFADILQLNAVKYLQGKNKQVFDFMSLFTSTDSKQFQAKVSGFKNLMDNEKLAMDDVIKKKQYVQICSLKLENSNHKYNDLANILNIQKDDVEQWAIEAIAAGIIDAKIDQVKEEIVIKSHIMNQEWKAIKERLREWSTRFSVMQSMLNQTKTN